MKFSEWQPWYNKICQTLHYNQKRDKKAAEILSQILRTKKLASLSNLRDQIKQKRIVLIFGKGQSLVEHLNVLKDFKSKFFIFSADGATSTLIENKILPNAIITDLDGKIEDLVLANSKGSIVIIHAHSDNIHLLDEVHKFIGLLLGTTQNEPFSNLWNFGGFSDGDRCAFMAEELGAQLIILAGMDLNRAENDIQAKKLSFAKELLSWLAINGKSQLLNLSTEGIPNIPFVSSFTLDNFLKSYRE
ncbi:MAG: DUF115 domain-containing protein [Euryarchaeota archaeon]|nr:DUF115 domain-containing protein [Euryarchaeota archaeon]